jgi:hypothetical protein
MKYIWLLFCITALVCKSQAQQEDALTNNDSIKRAEFLNYLGNGYLPTKYFDFDLRYLIKYNQYEGFRTGLGGITNEAFSKAVRLEGYSVYGFLDHRFKYSFGGGVRIAEKTNTWINLSYTDDLEETGSSLFLTDKRFFQFFEPRLLNISLFHRHITKSINIEHHLHPKIITESQFAVSKIIPTYEYIFRPHGDEGFSEYSLTIARISLQWSPFSHFKREVNAIVEAKTGYPKFTLQYTKSFENLFDGNFGFSKLDLRIMQHFNYDNDASTQLVFTGGMVGGDIPLTHLYHAYPNNVNKETILQRFSVAGTNSFETMYFNEFFSDEFATVQIKHLLSPFNISPWFKPRLVLISRFALGTMDGLERHENQTFETLEKGFFESGLEINELFFGFGFSFAYRYGAYHLPRFDDNIAFKFTFNINLNK